jgi:pre-mRNA-splicing factor CDC5/CEF1
LIKQLQDSSEQLEQARLEHSTFEFLKLQEQAAIPRRMEVSPKQTNKIVII